MTPSPIWRLAPGQRLLHRCWDGECVLYNDLSGDTHLLDEFALAVLQQLQAQPHSAAQLAACFDIEADADVPAAADGANVQPAPPALAPHEREPHEFLHAMLTDLSALHLIDPIAC